MTKNKDRQHTNNILGLTKNLNSYQMTMTIFQSSKSKAMKNLSHLGCRLKMMISYQIILQKMLPMSSAILLVLTCHGLLMVPHLMRFRLGLWVSKFIQGRKCTEWRSLSICLKCLERSCLVAKIETLLSLRNIVRRCSSQNFGTGLIS